MDFDHTFIVDKTRDFPTIDTRGFPSRRGTPGETSIRALNSGNDSRTFVVNHSSNLLSRAETNRYKLYSCQRSNEQAVNREEIRF